MIDWCSLEIHMSSLPVGICDQLSFPVDAYVRSLMADQPQLVKSSNQDKGGGYFWLTMYSTEYQRNASLTMGRATKIRCPPCRLSA